MAAIIGERKSHFKNRRGIKEFYWHGRKLSV